MLAIEVEFLTGRYIATTFNDRGSAEWPPHPARLFSALAATLADDPQPDERQALEWLEKQGAPAIRASDASQREVVTVFVPVNDATGAKVVPENRERQPRTFPSVTPRESIVSFAWSTAPPEGLKEALDRLAGRLVRLGHSSSLVSARVVERDIEPTWWPVDESETRLRIPRPGQLALLDRLFEQHRETEPRVMPSLSQPYSRLPASIPERIHPSGVFGEDWLVFRRVGGPRLPSVAGPLLAQTFRRALLKYSEQPPPEILSGHRSDGSPSERPHAAFVPLPNVGHEHSDGSVLGLAILIPTQATENDRRSVFRAIAAWEKRGEAGESEPLAVTCGRAGIVSLQRLEDTAEQSSLRPATWSGPARRWVSVMPVALDRNPGDLRAASAKAVSEAEETIRHACVRVGLSAPTSVTILPAAPLPGAAKAQQFPPFPEQPGKTRRVLTHAAIEFDELVRGPLLLGAGRYLGLGLFRPVVNRG